MITKKGLTKGMDILFLIGFVLFAQIGGAALYQLEGINGLFFGLISILAGSIVGLISLIWNIAYK